MESLWKLLYLLEPASLVLVTTAVVVVFASAQRALSHEKDWERHRDFADSSITLDGTQALMIPIASSCSLLLMFYLFASVSQLVTILTAVASASSIAFCLAPHTAHLISKVGLKEAMTSRCCCGNFTRLHGFLAIFSSAIVALWLMSGYWMLNNLLGICLCVAFVSHVRLPNIKICSLLLLCLFFYDIFWVFYSEHFFGANVMVSVATQQASNPIHTVASSLKLPGLQSITKKLELPVKLVFPRDLFGGVIQSGSGTEFMMLGLGDMAIPGMLLSLVLCFDHRKCKDHISDIEMVFPKKYKYIWGALLGYAIGLVSALAAGVLTQSPQPALLYLVPSTLGPVTFFAWARCEFLELWNGPRPILIEKARLMEV